MKKTDLYTLIHKAQRGHLFALSSRIGKTDFSDPQEVNAIKHELDSILAHLRKHSLNELTFIHPLYLEIGDQSAMIDEEHDELEQEILKLEEIIAEGRWEKLYAQFNRYIASYLLHQDEEERAQEEILWKHFDDTRLSAAMNAFLASRSPAVAIEDLKFVIPHLSNQELEQMFTGMKKSMPTHAFQGACGIAESLLEPNRWDQLHRW